jgi:hypothetical protein
MPNTYGVKITQLGLAKLTNAELHGIKVNLVEMAVGDGAGNEVTPNVGQTVLVREVYRRSINAHTLAPDTQNTRILEMVIPSEVGPFVVREVGIFDDDGDLIAVGNVPASVKSVPDQGASRDMVLQVYLALDNADVVNVLINPNIVLATRQWVDTFYLRLPGTGTTGQLVRKKTNLPNDFEYFNPEFDATNFVFDAVEEAQILTTDQVIVDFATITTAGIAVYVQSADGHLERLRRGIDYTITNATRITLAQSYPDTTQILGVQNDPNSTITPHGINALDRTLNGSDILDKALFRNALSVFSQQEINQALNNKAALGGNANQFFKVAHKPFEQLTNDDLNNAATLFFLGLYYYPKTYIDQFINTKTQSDERYIRNILSIKNKQVSIVDSATDLQNLSLYYSINVYSDKTFKIFGNFNVKVLSFNSKLTFKIDDVDFGNFIIGNFQSIGTVASGTVNIWSSQLVDGHPIIEVGAYIASSAVLGKLLVQISFTDLTSSGGFPSGAVHYGNFIIEGILQ